MDEILNLIESVSECFPSSFYNAVMYQKDAYGMAYTVDSDQTALFPQLSVYISAVYLPY